ncbi:MAG: ribosomal-processing cysteine protease Prp [Candidatus Moeniiplasma glomeromycotorum]|nr:ribosomal-processing cysteine protease Prp [Candidatus Moeniiplasma glomeromycotorum]MCE8162222.1 ribosomal-processing cysteine protease Prp [Candidatus Moeniiplasma glomeromycotorum]MCE8166122.1 ribosomal-processing cysteine protease Prp [Candidatus Moeniiplasma glomeromycotorum]MCE8166621.1 ribosomal-processing cysteine protease Prp [Candidatus Moeniiplasma glomeromycotorum]
MTTKISYKLDQKNNFKYFNIQGHAGYAEKGQDIVCAAISAITNGTINFLHQYYSTDCQIVYLPTKISIQLLSDNSDCQLVLKLMLYQLKNVANSHSNYLEIKKE